MRKYRVWCVNNKEWEKDDYFLTRDGILYQDIRGMLVPCRDDSHIICFFTGLHDRNDKEIWEGDIIRDIDSKKCGQVIWDTEEVCFTSLFSNNEKWGFVASKGRDRHCEIIGTIYENQELVD